MSLVIKQNINHKYQQVQAVLDEDFKVTLSYLEMEEQAAFSAPDTMIEKYWSLMQEIEQDLIRLSVSKSQVHTVCMHAQIQVRCVCIRTQLTQSWSFPPMLTVPPTQTYGNNFPTSQEDLTPPSMSSACRDTAVIAITGR